MFIISKVTLCLCEFKTILIKPSVFTIVSRETIIFSCSFVKAASFFQTLGFYTSPPFFVRFPVFVHFYPLPRHANALLTPKKQRIACENPFFRDCFTWNNHFACKTMQNGTKNSEKHHEKTENPLQKLNYQKTSPTTSRYSWQTAQNTV